MSISYAKDEEAETRNGFFNCCLSKKRSVAPGNGKNEKQTVTLILCRHGESTWNIANKFTGWYDCPLSPHGHVEAIKAGQLIRDEGYKLDVAYSSVLKRANQTLNHVLDESNYHWIPITKRWELNERHYGGLTGLNKQKTAEQYGEEQVHIWRRSYDILPPTVEKSSEYHPSNDERYNHLIFPDEFTESLATTLDRVVPYYKNEIEPVLMRGKTVIVSAHGNSLRALVKYLDDIDEETIPNLCIPTGVPLVYTFDRDMNVIPSDAAISPLRGRYLGDQDEVKERILGVQNQGKATLEITKTTSTESTSTTNSIVEETAVEKHSTVIA